MLKDEVEDSTFKSLVGDYYQQFLNTTQLTTEVADLDSLAARVTCSGIRGSFTFLENVVMVDSTNNIWAAVLIDKKVHYFTNHPDFVDSLPTTIEKWRKNFEDVPLITNH